MLSKSWLWLNENANLINLLMAQPVGSVAVTTNFGRELHRWHWRSIKVSNGGPKLECGGMGGAHCIKVGRDRQFWELGVFFFFFMVLSLLYSSIQSHRKEIIILTDFFFFKFHFGFFFPIPIFPSSVIGYPFSSLQNAYFMIPNPTHKMLSLSFFFFFLLGGGVDGCSQEYLSEKTQNKLRIFQSTSVQCWGHWYGQ